MTPKQWAEYQRQADVIEQEQKRIKNMTAVEWLFNKVKKVKIIDEHEEDLYYQAVQMEKQQKEISDEEIEKVAYGIEDANMRTAFQYGACWYREQLKQK